jgi:hypothetical protein
VTSGPGRGRRSVTYPYREPDPTSSVPDVTYPITRRIKMSEDHAQRDLYTLLLDRLRHGAQYAEACRVTIEDAIALLEAAQREEAKNETLSPAPARIDPRR